MNVVEVRVLGPTEATRDGNVIDLGGRQQRRLLCALAADVGIAVPADRLVERIWAGDDRPKDPRRTLHTYITRLRKALGHEALLTEGAGWMLAGDLVRVDAARFDTLATAADNLQLRLDERVDALTEALGLWRGPAYDDVAGEEWIAPEIARLDELRLRTTERRYDAMIESGRHTEAIPPLRADVAANPLSERLVHHLMVALQAADRQGEAAQAFQEYRRLLGTELGLEPGAEISDLDRRILADDPQLKPRSDRAMLGSYELGEQLGEGSFAVVYRGVQSTLQREVAIKVIRAELANQPDFIRRFEAEALLVASLEHPHIVPLYDYWREVDSAYLVFRYLRGGSLESRLTLGPPLSLSEVRPLMEQIASALSAAHEANVIHRDIKPANIFLDDQGAYYLGDFGIAVDATTPLDPVAALSAGSPAYASPEQLRREAVGPETDVYAFGVTLFEALTGDIPYSDARDQAELLERQLHEPLPSMQPRRPDLPAALDSVLARATSKNPSLRPSSLAEFVEDFIAALDETAPASDRQARPGTATVIEVDRNPYKGLRAFTEADASDFRGRERLVSRLVDLMREPTTRGRVLAVVGPSGIGKSSVVRAGLLPALRRGAVPGSDRWFIATMKPGTDPFDELAAALLRIASHPIGNVISALDQGSSGIARVAKALIPEDEDGEILLVIDQFEELFSLGDPDETARFLDALERAITDARCPLRVLLTIRADFWDQPLRYGSFARLIESSTVNVTALAPDELEQAITEPAYRAGGDFEPGLVSKIVADVTDQPGALPLLQYALTELWDRRVSGMMTQTAYAELGGIGGALVQRAERIHDDATPAVRAAVRRLFGRLVTPGEGTADTRRRALLAEITDDHERTALDAFGAARLLTFDRDPSNREPTVEVTHEALIREWPRLRTWLDDDRDAIRVARHLSAAALEWDKAGRAEAELYRGGRLEAAEALVADQTVGPLESAFLDASQQLRQASADAQRRSRRRLLSLSAAALVFALVASVVGVLAVRERGRADDRAAEAEVQARRAEESEDAADAARREADLRRMASEAAVLSEEDPAVAMLIAATLHDEGGGLLAEDALAHTLLRSDGFLGFMSGGETYSAVALTDTKVVARSTRGLEIWELDSKELTAIELPRGAELAVDAASGLAATSFDGTRVALIDLDEGIELGRLELDDAVRSLAVAGPRLAVGTSDGTVHVLGSDMQALSQPWVLPADADRQLWATALAIADDGATVYVGDQTGGAHAYDTASGTALWRLTIEERMQAAGFPARVTTESLEQVNGIAPLSQGRVLVSTTTLFSVVDTDSGDPEATTRKVVGTSSSINVVGDLVLSGGSLHGLDNLAVERRRFSKGLVRASALHPDGSIVALAEADTIRLVATDGSGLISSAFAAAGGSDAFVSSDDTMLLANLPDLQVRVWDIESGREQAVDFGPALGRAAFLQTDAAMSWHVDGRTRIWGPDFEPQGSTPSENWLDLTTTRDLRFGLVGTTTPAGHVRVYDLATEDLVVELPELRNEVLAIGRAGGIQDTITQIVVAPDDRFFVAIAGGLAALYDIESWRLRGFLDADGAIANIAVSHDGATIAAQRLDGQIYLFSADDLERTAEPLDVGLAEPALLNKYSVVFTPDDERLIVSAPTSIQIWDLGARVPVGPKVPTSQIPAVPSARGTKIVTGTDDSIVVWDLDSDGWRDLACVAAGRNMTVEEWRQHGPQGAPYRATCPQWPAAT